MWDSILLLPNTENFDFNPLLKILSYIHFSWPDSVYLSIELFKYSTYQMSKLYVVDGNNDKRENKGRNFQNSIPEPSNDENQKYIICIVEDESQILQK